MSWEVEYLPEANQDLKNLDGSQRLLVLKAIKKVQQNPISIYEGGYGKPLGNKNGSDLSGFLKVKLKSAGLRVVYKVVRQDDKMLIIVIVFLLPRNDQKLLYLTVTKLLVIMTKTNEKEKEIITAQSFDEHKLVITSFVAKSHGYYNKLRAVCQSQRKNYLSES